MVHVPGPSSALAASCFVIGGLLHGVLHGSSGPGPADTSEPSLAASSSAAEAVTLSAQEWTVGVASVARLCGVFLLLGFGLGLWACYRLTSFWHAIAGPRVAVSVENQTALSVHPAHGAPKATRSRRGRGGVLELPPAGP